MSRISPTIGPTDDKNLELTTEYLDPEVTGDKIGQPENWKAVLDQAVHGEAVERTLTWKSAVRLYPKAIFWTVAICMNVIMEGFDMALIGSLVGIPTFRRKYGTYANEKSGYQLSPGWQSALQQSNQIGMFFGVMLNSYFLPRYGHRRSLQFALVGMAFFIFIVFFAPRIEVLFVGEILCALPWGVFAATSTSYASEVAPVALRGYLTTYVDLCFTIGQILASAVLYAVQGRSDSWAYRIPFAVQWVWPIPLFILATYAPESPWWLVRKGRFEDAEHSLRRLSKQASTLDTASIVAMMKRTDDYERANAPGRNASIWDCFKGVDLRRTEITTVGFSIQFTCGLLMPGPYFFQQAGLNASDSFKMGFGQSALGFVGVLSSWITMTYFGRRTMYLVGLMNCFIILFVTGMLSIPGNNGSKGAAWAQGALMLIFKYNFNLTLGPIGYAILAEVSSTRLRTHTVGLGRNLHSIWGIVGGVLNTYMMNPTAWNLRGYTAMFWAGTTALSWLWCYFRLPECKGRTYRELDVLFEKRIPARKFKTTHVELDSEETATV